MQVNATMGANIPAMAAIFCMLLKQVVPHQPYGQ